MSCQSPASRCSHSDSGGSRVVVSRSISASVLTRGSLGHPGPAPGPPASGPGTVAIAHRRRPRALDVGDPQ